MLWITPSFMQELDQSSPGLKFNMMSCLTAIQAFPYFQSHQLLIWFDRQFAIIDLYWLIYCPPKFLPPQYLFDYYSHLYYYFVAIMIPKCLHHHFIPTLLSHSSIRTQSQTFHFPRSPPAAPRFYEGSHSWFCCN